MANHLCCTIHGRWDSSKIKNAITIFNQHDQTDCNKTQSMSVSFATGFITMMAMRYNQGGTFKNNNIHAHTCVILLKIIFFCGRDFLCHALFISFVSGSSVELSISFATSMSNSLNPMSYLASNCFMRNRIFSTSAFNCVCC